MLQKLKIVLILTYSKTPNTFPCFLNKHTFDRDTLTKTFFFCKDIFKNYFSHYKIYIYCKNPENKRYVQIFCNPVTVGNHY